VQGFFYLFLCAMGWVDKTGQKCFAQHGVKQVLIALG
jgi:hypothetical protein